MLIAIGEQEEEVEPADVDGPVLRLVRTGEVYNAETIAARGVRLITATPVEGAWLEHAGYREAFARARVRHRMYRRILESEGLHNCWSDRGPTELATDLRDRRRGTLMPRERHALNLVWHLYAGRGWKPVAMSLSILYGESRMLDMLANLIDADQAEGAESAG